MSSPNEIIAAFTPAMAMSARTSAMPVNMAIRTIIRTR